MNYSRIGSVIPVQEVEKKEVAVVGCGGVAGLVKTLRRCGVRRFRLVDQDTVGAENLARQDFTADQVGTLKVVALAQGLNRIDSDTFSTCFPRDWCSFADAEIDEHFSDIDLFLFATDSFPAQARGNEVALRLRKPAVWMGLYPGGRAGEIVFWHPGLASCFRCLAEERYKVFERGNLQKISSNGADMLAVSLIDSLAGMIALGLLTTGEGNRYGSLLKTLGERNFLQVKVDSDWTWNGRDIFRETLGIPEGNEAYIGFCTIARRNPDPGGQCPDCRRFLGCGL